MELYYTTTNKDNENNIFYDVRKGDCVYINGVPVAIYTKLAIDGEYCCIDDLRTGCRAIAMRDTRERAIAEFIKKFQTQTQRNIYKAFEEKGLPFVNDDVIAKMKENLDKK